MTMMTCAFSYGTTFVDLDVLASPAFKAWGRRRRFMELFTIPP